MKRDRELGEDSLSLVRYDVKFILFAEPGLVTLFVDLSAATCTRKSVVCIPTTVGLLVVIPSLVADLGISVALVTGALGSDLLD